MRELRMYGSGRGGRPAMAVPTADSRAADVEWRSGQRLTFGAPNDPGPMGAFVAGVNKGFDNDIALNSSAICLCY